MRGTFFKKPLEFLLVTDGESWRQGEKIKGTMKVKSLATEAVTLSKVVTSISYGDIKKVRAKDAKAWSETEEKVLAENLKLSPNSEQEFSFEFNLKDDAPITEKAKSLYILYGEGNNLVELGNLQLHIESKEIIDQILMIFENFFRFKVASKKYKKSFVEVKFNPPGSSKELANVDALTCLIRYHETNIEMNYNFKLRALEAIGTDVSVQKKTKDFKQVLTKRDYEVFGGLNQDKIIEKINEVLKDVIPSILY